MNNITSIGSREASIKERNVLRDLASRVMEISTSPLIKERKSAWKASNDLKSKRPLILVETIAMEGFKDESKILCTDPFLRDVEKALREMIRHYTDIDDDYVIEPYYRIPWRIKNSGFGVNFGEKHAINYKGDNTAYSFDYPIKHIEDIEKLKHNQFTVFKTDTQALANKLDNAIGDIMPIRIGGLDLIFTEWDGIFSLNTDAINSDGSRRYLGYTPFIGSYFIGIGFSMFKLMGNENLMYWSYDHPDVIHALADFICKDRINFFQWIQNEGLIDSNADNQIIGSGPLGYVSCLPEPSHSSNHLSINHIWGWAEAQEAGIFSPDMFNEFFLPYIAKVANKFGLISYGCCEKLEDRVQNILNKISNIRSVAISPWNSDKKMAEILGNKYTYCRKIMPSYISAENVEWGLLEKEIKDIHNATKDCNLQLVIRDVYDINRDFKRLTTWAKLARKILGI